MTRALGIAVDHLSPDMGQCVGLILLRGRKWLTHLMSIMSDQKNSEGVGGPKSVSGYLSSTNFSFVTHSIYRL
jgi:hypothetical protein